MARISKNSAITALRTERGMTQKELAEKAGINPRTMERYEQKGIFNAPVSAMCKIAHILNTSVEAIVLKERQLREESEN